MRKKPTVGQLYRVSRTYISTTVWSQPTDYYGVYDHSKGGVSCWYLARGDIFVLLECKNSRVSFAGRPFVDLKIMRTDGAVGWLLEYEQSWFYKEFKVQGK